MVLRQGLDPYEESKMGISAAVNRFTKWIGLQKLEHIAFMYVLLSVLLGIKNIILLTLRLLISLSIILPVADEAASSDTPELKWREGWDVLKYAIVLELLMVWRFSPFIDPSWGSFFALWLPPVFLGMLVCEIFRRVPFSTTYER